MRPAVITPSGGAEAHDRSEHAGLGGIREPRIRPWRNWEDRRGSQRSGKDRESCGRPCRGARESRGKCRHCRGCGNSPEPITIRSRTCRRRSWWTTPCNVIHSTAPPVGPSPNPCAVHTGHRRGDRTPAETRGVRPRPASDPEPAGRGGATFFGSSRGTDMTMTMHGWATARRQVRSETADLTEERLPNRPTAGPERQDQNDRTRTTGPGCLHDH